MFSPGTSYLISSDLQPEKVASRFPDSTKRFSQAIVDDMSSIAAEAVPDALGHFGPYGGRFVPETLMHTGAHKINNCIGQILLARSMGKTRIIAETGAGQHGVATATVAAMFGLKCVVYMGAVDCERQALNVFRMKMLGAEVVPVKAGQKTLKEAINEAMRDWVTNVRTTHYIL